MKYFLLLISIKHEGVKTRKPLQSSWNNLVLLPRRSFRSSHEKSIPFFLDRMLITNVLGLKYSLLTHMASNIFWSSTSTAVPSNDSYDLLLSWIINYMIYFFHDSFQLKQDSRPKLNTYCSKETCMSPHIVYNVNCCYTIITLLHPRDRFV